MFVNFNSKSLSNHLISVLFIITLNLFQNFCVNANSISFEFNKTVTSSSDAWTAPKLLGIFADGVNDSTIIPNNNTLTPNVDIYNQVQNESKITAIRKIIPIQEIVKNLLPTNVPQSESNSSQASAQDVANYLDSAVEPTEANRVLPLNPCKKLRFRTNKENNKNQLQESVRCVLGNPSEARYSRQQSTHFGVPFAASTPLRDVDFYSYNIPDDDSNEVINDTSYIAIMLDVCSEPKGEVLIIDQMSNQQLLSFNNMGTTRICNHWENEFESFVSDSNKVKIELGIPIDDTAMDGPHTEFEFLDPSEPNILNGRRRVWNKHFQLNLVYFEIKFDNKESEELETDDKEREVIYQPNSVFTYKLMPPSKNDKNEIKVGVKIELKLLQIDEDAGDFVLIGPGHEPTHRELSSAQIFSKNIGEDDVPKNIYVNADSAYIRLVTHNSFKHGTALKFSWEAPNDTLADIGEEQWSDRVKNSAIKICVLDSMCDQFQNALEDRFKEEMAHITNDFLFKKQDGNEEEETKKLVSKKSVLIIDRYNGVYPQSDKNKIYCQISVAITSAFNEQWPLVSHTTLNYIFFGNDNHRDMFSSGTVRMTDCSHEPISLLKMILPIIVILIVSIVLLFIAWRYQYRNWTHMQRTENAKYTNPPVDDPNEDQLYAKDNPIFVDDENNFQSNKGRTSQTNRSIDSVDGKPTAEHKPLNKQLSHGSSTSSRKLPSVKESPEFVKNLWLSPGTSRQQNEYVWDDIHISSDDKSDDNMSTSHTTRDNMSKANSYSKSSGDTLTAQLPITGLNGTQHESLRYPRSALRRPTIVTDNEIPIQMDGNPVRRGSKVQFELPIKSNKLTKNSDSVDESIE